MNRASVLRPILRPLGSTAPRIPPTFSPTLSSPSPAQAVRTIVNTPQLGAVKDAISAVLHGSSEARAEAGTQHSRAVGRHVSRASSRIVTSLAGIVNKSMRGLWLTRVVGGGMYRRKSGVGEQILRNQLLGRHRLTRLFPLQKYVYEFQSKSS
jgi:hypothetical protein